MPDGVPGLLLELFAALVLLIGLALVAVAVRRRVLHRSGGTIDLSLRWRQGRGWVLGLGRFAGDELLWYPVFSLAPRPRHVLPRPDLRVDGRRAPGRSEAPSLPAGVVVVSCRSGDRPVELAMDGAAVAGFLAWLEARPPGATLPG